MKANQLCGRFAKTLLTILGVGGLGIGSALAQYYILAENTSTGAANNSGGAAGYGNYWEPGTAYAHSSGKTSAPGAPTQTGSRYRTSMTTSDGFDIQLMGDSAPGAVYLLDVSVPSSNAGTDIVYTATSTNATLSFSSTTAFQSSVASSPNWSLVGYLTNNPGVIHPHVQFIFSSGNINGGARSYATVFRFRPAGCGSVDAPIARGPFSAGQTSVTVAQVTNATAVTVYQNSGGGMVQIGRITTGIVNGNNTVPTSALIKGAQLAATQTVGGQESCVPTAGAYVGGGANPRIRLSLDIRQTGTMTGPIGTTGPTTGGGLYFLQANQALNSSAPAGGILVQPTSCWQTIKIDPRTAPQSSVWSGSWTGQAYPDRSPWAELECIAFVMDDTSDTGPFAIYIDNLANGTNLIQDFEGHSSGDSVTFLPPNAAGFPVGMLINPPNTAAASANNASSGTNSCFVNFQFSGPSTANWVRWYAGAATAGYPELDMTQPIYFDILVLPVGQGTGHSVGTVGYMLDLTNCPGESATFSIYASGPTPLTYQWQFNGANIPGATTSTFTTNNVSSSSSGIYTVVVSDGTCSLTRDAHLTVRPVATFDYQPSNLNVNVGDGAYFSISATASTVCLSQPAFGYRWRHNGTNLVNNSQITGADTPNLQVANCQIADAGLYSVAVTNTFDTVLSSNAILHVVDSVNQVFGNGNGLLGLYYSNSTAAAPFTSAPAWTNSDYNINFDWTNQAPDIYPIPYNGTTVVGADRFTVRWVGEIQGQWNQDYTFYSLSDDGIRLFINGQLVIDSWIDQGATVERSGTIALTTNHQDILIEYYENTGNAVARLWWESASQIRDFVPGSQLYAATSWQAPAITLTAPPNGAGFNAPGPITLSAAVTPNHNSITKVQFYSYGTNLLGEVLTSPYNFNWNTAAGGTYSISARLVYNVEGTLDTPTHTITVTNLAPPYISGITLAAGNISIAGTGQLGQTFVLYNVSSLAAPLTWTPIATNSSGSGSFNFIFPPGPDPASLFKVQSR